jgi:ABC-type multidrug transport system fused ATPase/permease subunit
MEEEVVGKIYDRRLMQRLLRYLWPYRRYVAISLIFLGINSLLQIAGPLLMKIAVDRYLAPAGKQMQTPLDAWLSAEP